MTPSELLELLHDRGLMELHDEMDGWFGWRVRFENGSAVMEVEFSSEETGEDTKRTWILTPVEVRRSGKRN